jgi:hypothetical protein
MWFAEARAEGAGEAKEYVRALLADKSVMAAALKDVADALDELVDHPCCGWGPLLTTVRAAIRRKAGVE